MIKINLTRRKFVKNMTVSIAGSSLCSNAFAAKHILNKKQQLAATKKPFAMEYRTLGKTGLKVSALSFGVMRLTEPAVLFEAIEMGINYFDTAHVYQHGNNEIMLGKALKQSGRKKVFIATKIIPFNKLGKEYVLNNTSAMEKMLDKSLKRLQTDYVDVLFLHAIKNPAWPANNDMLSFLENAKKAGKARFVGISLHEAGQPYVDIVDSALKTDFYDVLLATINYKSPPEHIAVLKRAKNKNLGIIAMKTQAGGYAQVAGGSLNPHQAALKWAFSCSFVDCAIPGMVNRKQLIENSSALGKKLGWGDRKTLNAYYNSIKNTYCVRCGGCFSSCRKNVDIPAVHRALMYWEAYKDYNLGRDAYREMISENQALSCIQCKLPTCKCVNEINIAERMNYAHSVFA